jgi:hypothetical protein
MKRRSRSAPTGNAGVTALREYCDRHELIFQAEPREDFGIDCYLEVEAAECPQNFIVGMQVKSGPSHRYNRNDGSFTIGVKPDDVAYWLAANYPVLLVYRHERGELFFRHVQAAFEEEATISTCTSLRFSEADAAEGALAEYVRDLARSTPSVLNRFRVLSEPASLHIGTDDVRMTVLGDPVTTLSFDKYRCSSISELRDRFQLFDRVLGYSLDDQWVCELRCPDGGQGDGFEAAVAFVNLDTNAAHELRLFTQEQTEMAFIHEGAFDWRMLDAAIDRLNKLAAILKIAPARALYDAYHATLEPHLRAPIHLAFGAEEIFSLTTGSHLGRDSLLLSAQQYRPVRTAHLLVERTPHAYLLMLDEVTPSTVDDLVQMTVPLTYDYVCGVTRSHSGSRITFAVMTQTSHDCWGTRSVHLTHFTIAHLRRLCADALRA